MDDVAGRAYKGCPVIHASASVAQRPRRREAMNIEDLYRNCTEATAAFVHALGFDEVVIGLSGGVDSSLVATIAVDALGAQQVHGVLMPGPYSSAHSVDDAETLARNLNIETMTIPIIEPYEAFAHQIAKATGAAFGGLAAENTQARCRMVVVMALSNRYGWLMLNTGNRSEACMGYSTLYGDTAGAFAPIGGLYKTQVYETCAWRNRQAVEAGEVPPIPEHVLVKPPSAELAPGQIDEAALGVNYATLDRILMQLLDEGKSVDDVAASGFDRGQVAAIARRYAAFAFKRALEPPYPGSDH